MPVSLFREWLAYEALEPFGSWRDNFHAALIAAILANANRDPKKTPVPFKVSDFFYVDTETQRDAADAQMLGALRAVSKTKGQTKQRKKPKQRVVPPSAAQRKRAKSR